MKQMLLFLDTEFTDFIDCHLISIGMVSADGRQFYCERNDYPKESCSPFVLAAVIPQLSSHPDCIADHEELRRRLFNWLEQFRADGDVIVCFDYGGDWDLFCDALDGEIPSGIFGANISSTLSIQAA